MRIGRWHGRLKLWALMVAVVLALTATLVVVAATALDRPSPRRRAVATHVPTWAYDDWTPAADCNGGGDGHRGTPAALVDAWVTYAESNCGPEALTTKAIDDCMAGGRSHCTPVAYLETSFDYASNRPPARGFLRKHCRLYASPREPSSWWLHGPDGARLRKDVDGATDNYLFNQSTPAVQRFFARYVRTCLSGYRGLMLDDADTSLSALLSEVVGDPQSTREIPTDQELIRDHQELANALASLTNTHHSHDLIIDNALSDNPSVPLPWALLGRPRAVQGVIAEGDPVDGQTASSAAPLALAPDATGRPNAGFYATLLDEIAYVDNAAADGLSSRDFMVMLSYDGSGQRQARILVQATEMLGYHGDSLVDWADLETKSDDLAVWPEEGLVPTRPLRSMGPPRGVGCLRGAGDVCTRGGHTDLEVPQAPGVYLREFAMCDDRGRPIGACAAIVNDTQTAIRVRGRWLRQRYRWTITLRGGDVQSGGQLDLRGTRFRPGRTLLAADSGILLRARS